MTADNQRANVRVAAEALAPVALEHELVISHGNGPQVGLLALQGAAYKEVETYPLDVLGAQTEGMIGYLIEQELGNLLPFEKPFATHPDDGRGRPATTRLSPTRQVHRPGLRTGRRRTAGAEKGWAIKQDGDMWRRVVPSPLPTRIFEIRPIKWLLEKGAVVICTGGGGIPTMYENGTKRLIGAEVVIDKDRASALLARELEADVFVMATDVDGVYLDFGTPTSSADRADDADRARRHELCRRLDGPQGRGRRRFRPSEPASAPPSARSPRSAVSSPARTGTSVDPGGLTASPRPRHAGANRASPSRSRHRHPHRADHHDCRAVRHRRDRRSAAGLAAAGGDACRLHGLAAGPSDGGHPRCRHWRRRLCHGRRLHPARRGRTHRHLEHGRHDPDDRVLRHRAAPAERVLPLRAGHLRARRAIDRQLVDDCGNVGRGARSAGAGAGRFYRDHRGRSHLGRLLRRQDDADLGDDGAGAVDGRRRYDPASTSAP